MDWTLAISRNREALLRIIAALFNYAGLANGVAFSVLPRHVYRTFLRFLRPAESAVRRLIIIAARGLMLNPVPARVVPGGFALIGGAPRKLAFPLIDPLKRFLPDTPFAKKEAPPRISVPGLFDPVFIAPLILSSEDPVNATNLSQRLAALNRALENLAAQARRLARWQARRDLALQKNVPCKPRRITPFRPGSPPGARLRRNHEVDHILRECHALVLDMLADTS